jgi:hypothetical protein
MPTDAGDIGGLSLPLAAGSDNTDISDPLLDGLLAYFSHWLNEQLNTRLAVLTGIENEAVPSGRTHAVNPGAAFVRYDMPALFMWRSRMKTEAFDLIHDVNTDELTALWVFQQVDAPHEVEGLQGLYQAVRGTLAQATITKAHRTFTPSGWPQGTDLMRAYSLEGIQFNGATPGTLFEVPGQRSAARAGRGRGDGQRQRAFFAVRATWQVIENVDFALRFDDPDDLTRESTVTAGVDDYALMERYAMPPDGTEDL